MIEFPEVLHSKETVYFLLGNTRYRVTCVNEYELYVETKDISESKHYPAVVGTIGYYQGCILFGNHRSTDFLDSKDVQTMAYVLKDRYSEVTYDEMAGEWKTLRKLADVRSTIDLRPVRERISKYLENKKIAKHSVNNQCEGAD